MSVFQTYIIYSASLDRYYVGYTGAGVEKRLERHNAGWTTYTRQGIPWELKYYRCFETKREALKWERFIKQQKSRVFIEKLLQSKENILLQ